MAKIITASFFIVVVVVAIMMMNGYSVDGARKEKDDSIYKSQKTISFFECLIWYKFCLTVDPAYYCPLYQKNCLPSEAPQPQIHP